MGGGKDVLSREARYLGGSGGILREKNKIQGVAGAFWSGFGTYKLRAQPTCAHTRTNCACESQRPRKSARLF